MGLHATQVGPLAIQLHNKDIRDEHRIPTYESPVADLAELAQARASIH